MAESVARHKCRTCGVSVAATAMVVGGAPRPAAVAAGLTFCSPGCLTAHTAASLKRRRCAGCGGWFVPGAGPGRPADYCEVRCRRERERLYARALRRLVRGRDADPVRRGDGPGDWRVWAAGLEAALAELDALLVRLRGRRPDGGAGTWVDEARLPVADSRGALTAACGQEINRLTGLLSEARRGEVAAFDAARDAAGPSWPGVSAQRREQWRAERERVLAATEGAV